jgi:hypothetical protein
LAGRSRLSYMPSNPDSRIEFRDVELAQFYDENFTRDQRSLAAKRDLERYRYLIEESLPKLSESEAIALWTALNGINTSHVETLPILKQSVISELVEDGQTELAHKIKEWKLCQWFAVVDACDRVGGGTYYVDDLSEELKRVGIYA